MVVKIVKNQSLMSSDLQSAGRCAGGGDVTADKTTVSERTLASEGHIKRLEIKGYRDR